MKIAKRIQNILSKIISKFECPRCHATKPYHECFFCGEEIDKEECRMWDGCCDVCSIREK
jgi:hypothetical protein